jgi:HEAT repeat protein
MGRLGKPELRDALRALLGDAETEVRAAAATALVRLGEAEAIEPLVELLAYDRVPDAFEPEAAVRALGEPAVKPLLALLDHEDPYVAAAAARALPATGTRAPAALSALADAARRNRAPLPEAALAALGAAGEEAVPTLEPLAKGAPPALRAQIARTLGGIGRGRAMELLVAALKDTDEDVRWAAADALAPIADQDALWGLIAALRDGNEIRSIRVAAARALGRIGGERAMDALSLTLDTRSLPVRREAALALVRLGEARAVDPLLRSAEDRDEAGLAEIVAALVALGAPALDPLFAMLLEDTNADVRLRALKVIAAMRDPAAIGPLIHALKDADTRVVRGAIDALVELEPLAAEPS